MAINEACPLFFLFSFFSLSFSLSNGQLCVDLDDPMIARRGVFAFQIHSGGAMAVRFKDIKLEVLAPK